jgi:UDP-MurNAc hydroxylase
MLADRIGSDARGFKIMKLTFLGHAGFCVETDGVVIVCDPWLSPTGAFDASWFQLPSNHHLGPLVEEKLALPKAKKFVYISHEHEDHYDRAFLDSLQHRDFSLVIPRYRRPALRRELANYRCNEVLAVNDAEAISIPGGEIKLYLDDSELNRDSAIFVRADGRTFLNLNDCRIFDRLRTIVEEEGAIDAFTCQFSGAAWHPTCYEYDSDRFDHISENKVIAKFEMVRRGIECVRPRFYLPSAGPVCFLDPELMPINFKASGIFRRPADLLAYLEPTLAREGTLWKELMPGDSLDAIDGEISKVGGERYNDLRFASYVREYAKRYESFFEERERAAAAVDADSVFVRLREELRQKLALLPLRDRVDVPLFFGLHEVGRRLLVDFRAGTVEESQAVARAPFYSIVAHAWQIAKVLDGELTWENFGLSFRVRLNRVPDVYQPLIHAFLTLEKGDLYRFCRMIIELESRKDRIEVAAGGTTYTVNRYCPHNGGDLKEGWIDGDRYLVCPRHRWCFDLKNGGRCTSNVSSIFAEELETETLPAAASS